MTPSRPRPSITFLLSVGLLLSLAACGDPEKEDSLKVSSKSAEEEPKDEDGTGDETEEDEKDEDPPVTDEETPPLTGSGLPGEALGQNGDHYQDTDSGAFFRKSAGIWYALDKRDSQMYGYVTIGTQVWTAEAMRYGSFVSDATVGAQEEDGVAERFCYGDAEANCAAYGALYQWAEAMQFPFACNNDFPGCGATIGEPHQGVCPAGWHIPTPSEYEDLFSFVESDNGGDSNVGADLKATTTWDNNPGVDTYGFAYLAMGRREAIGGFSFMGQYGYAWSATSESGKGGTVVMNYVNNSAVHYASTYGNKNGMQVRCLLD